MTDDADRRRIIERAERMVGQSKRLRTISNELLRESHDIRRAARRMNTRRLRKKR